MSHLDLTDREIERVLAGHQPPGRPDLAEVAFLMARLRTVGDFEQAPPMNPRLLAELDAADVEGQPGAGSAAGPRAVAGGMPAPVPGAGRESGWSAGLERGASGRPYRPAHARRAGAMRRRWRLIGAAAVAIILGGVLVLASQDAGDPQRTEVADAGSVDEPPSTTVTVAPQTTTTTIPTTTAAPPTTTQPQTTTTAALPPPIEAPSPPLEPTPTSADEWPQGNGSGMSAEEFEEWAERQCDQRPEPEWCDWYEEQRDRSHNDSSP